MAYSLGAGAFKTCRRYCERLVGLWGAYNYHLAAGQCVRKPLHPCKLEEKQSLGQAKGSQGLMHWVEQGRTI